MTSKVNRVRVIVHIYYTLKTFLSGQIFIERSEEAYCFFYFIFAFCVKIFSVRKTALPGHYTQRARTHFLVANFPVSIFQGGIFYDFANRSH